MPFAVSNWKQLTQIYAGGFKRSRRLKRRVRASLMVTLHISVHIHMYTCKNICDAEENVCISCNPCYVGKKQTRKCVQPSLERSSGVIGGAVSKVSGGDGMKEKWSKENLSCADSRPVADHRPEGERSRPVDLKPKGDGTSMNDPQAKNDMLSKGGDQMLLKYSHQSKRVGTVSADIHSNAIGTLSLHSGRDGALVKKQWPKIADNVSAQAVGDVLGLDSEVSGVQWSEDTDDIPPLMMRLGRMALGTSTMKSASLPAAAAGTTANPIVID